MVTREVFREVRLNPPWHRSDWTEHLKTQKTWKNLKFYMHGKDDQLSCCQLSWISAITKFINGSAIEIFFLFLAMIAIQEMLHLKIYPNIVVLSFCCKSLCWMVESWQPSLWFFLVFILNEFSDVSFILRWRGFNLSFCTRPFGFISRRQNFLNFGQKLNKVTLRITNKTTLYKKYSLLWWTNFDFWLLCLSTILIKIINGILFLKNCFTNPHLNFISGWIIAMF